MPGLLPARQESTVRGNVAQLLRLPVKDAVAQLDSWFPFILRPGDDGSFRNTNISALKLFAGNLPLLRAEITPEKLQVWKKENLVTWGLLSKAFVG